MHRATVVIATIVVWSILLAVAAGAYICSGLYDIGADAHHTRPVAAMLQLLREQSIRMRARDITVPALDDPQKVLDGAGHYAAMCTGCHLAPGMKESEIRPGLYPQPPSLSHLRVRPQVAFWVIKHGIKMSAMPAWGTTHDDEAIWNMVAFVQKLPDLTPEQYKDMVAKAPPDEDMDMGDHAHPMPGMDTPAAHQHDETPSPAKTDEPVRR